MPTEVAATRPCLMQAWAKHRVELMQWFSHRTQDSHTAQDLHQEVFLKAMAQGEKFCSVVNARAWLFAVAHNILADQHRHKVPVELWPQEALEDFSEPTQGAPVVEQLTGCLGRVLTELDATDADIIRRCDLDGMTQQAYAEANGLGLPATKARLRRARERLRMQLTQSCQVQVSPNEGVLDFVPRS